MKHVFVETNFIVDLLRPFPVPDARALDQRVGQDVTLYLPWVAIAEAKRTLTRIVAEDLGFTAMMAKYVVSEFLTGTLSAVDKSTCDALIGRARARQTAETTSATNRIDALAARAVVIEPTKSVVTRALSMFPVKSLRPFDEMVLAAVLTKADELHTSGVKDLHFCDKNTKDFAPTNQNSLAVEYASCGLTFVPTFAVPP